MKKLIASLTMGAALSALIVAPAVAEEAPPRPAGSLFRAIAGDTLEKTHGIGLMGWVEATAVATDHDNRNVSPAGFFNTETGINFNQVGIVGCRTIGCPIQLFGPTRNLISRIGPFPGPKGEFDIGFNGTLLYGEDTQFFRTAGFDDFSFDDTNEHKLAIPQLFLDMYIPVLNGATVMLGSFQTPLANEIGYPSTPPNWFVTRSHAFEHGPAKHVGALATLNLPVPQGFGFMSVEGGLVAGWNNLEEPRATFIGGVRWRSPNFATWIDLEMIYGDGENDSFGPGEGGSPYIAISATDEELGRFAAYLTATHQLTPDLQLAVEATYGSQEGGNVAAAPFFITEDSAWYGANVGARYKLTDNIHFAARAEWLRDENAANVLWGSVGADGGNVTAFTAGLDWRLHPNLRIRPELRFDRYSGGGTGLFGGGTEDRQVLGLVNLQVDF